MTALLAFFTFLRGLCAMLPGWIWALIVAAVLVFNATTTMKLTSERRDHEHTKAQLAIQAGEYKNYQIKVADNARIAEQEKREVETQATNNVRKVNDENTVLKQKLAAATAALRSNAGRVRDKTIPAFTAGIARDTESGDTAAVAAKATAAVELYGACQQRYVDLGIEVEDLRIQALGLWRYIAGNRQCSQPFPGSEGVSTQEAGVGQKAAAVQGSTGETAPVTP